MCRERKNVQQKEKKTESIYSKFINRNNVQQKEKTEEHIAKEKRKVKRLYEI